MCGLGLKLGLGLGRSAQLNELQLALQVRLDEVHYPGAVVPGRVGLGIHPQRRLREAQFGGSRLGVASLQRRMQRLPPAVAVQSRFMMGKHVLNVMQLLWHAKRLGLYRRCKFARWQIAKIPGSTCRAHSAAKLDMRMLQVSMRGALAASSLIVSRDDNACHGAAAP